MLHWGTDAAYMLPSCQTRNSLMAQHCGRPLDRGWQTGQWCKCVQQKFSGRKNGMAWQCHSTCSNGAMHSCHLWLNTYLNTVNQRFAGVKQSMAASTNVVIMQRLTGGLWEYWLPQYIYRSMRVGLPPSIHQSWIPHSIYSKLAIYWWHCNILGYAFDRWCTQFNSSRMVCWQHVNGTQMCK